ncbi:MAG: type II toxin-antitoxin system prevent-host-death family antitoxin [Deltaproteobacteria bacterium]|nr:type II toxin-antitoxin system prevent-host-death family antitoxin [Deltaproteobacteria bacterium]
MKVTGARRLRDDLSGFMEKAQRTEIVVTKRGAPSVLIVGVEGLDWDDIQLGADDALWEELERRRHDPRPVPFEQALHRWGLVEKRPRRRRAPR